MSTEFFLTSLVVVLIPGTGVIYTVSNGLFLGRRASIAAAIGCTAGILPHLAASVLGLSAILHMSAVAFQAIKYAGAGYLLYLAWVMWRETGALKFRLFLLGKKSMAYRASRIPDQYSESQIIHIFPGILTAFCISGLIIPNGSDDRAQFNFHGYDPGNFCSLWDFRKRRSSLCC